MKKVELTNDQKIFLNNAFLFFKNRNRILSDKRMSLCRVPFQNGVFQSDMTGFGNPTLGTYLNWWLNCESAIILKEDESEWLIYRFSGTALDGTNKCDIVNGRGETDRISIMAFTSLWLSFASYDDGCYDDDFMEPYSLKEIIDILNKEGNNADGDKDIQIFFLQNALKKQKRELDIKAHVWKSKIRRLKLQLVTMHQDELIAFIDEYRTIEKRLLNEEKTIGNQIVELRKKLRSGEIDNKQFQKLFTPLKNERNKVKYRLNNCLKLSPNAFLAGQELTIDEIEHFLNKNEI